MSGKRSPSVRKTWDFEVEYCSSSVAWLNEAITLRNCCEVLFQYDKEVFRKEGNLS